MQELTRHISVPASTIAGWLASALTALVLVSCTPVPVQIVVEEPDQTQAPEIDGVVEVYPLTVPEVAVLAEQASVAQAAGDLASANRALVQALEINPTDPLLWQQLAELALVQEDFQAAIDHARHAFDIGPQVGQICFRNWHTMHQAQARLGLNQAAAMAAQRANLCALRAAPRY